METPDTQTQTKKEEPAAEGKKKILLVEDTKPIARAAALKLTNAGFDVEVANDGEAALAALTNNHFDLVFLDIIMPKKDGFAVLKEMREKNNNTPVVILSNLGQAGDIEQTKALGAKGFYIKADTPMTEVVNVAKRILNV